MCGSEVTDLKTAEQELAQSTGPICSECFNRTSQILQSLIHPKKWLIKSAKNDEPCYTLGSLSPYE